MGKSIEVPFLTHSVGLWLKLTKATLLVLEKLVKRVLGLFQADRQTVPSSDYVARSACFKLC